MRALDLLLCMPFSCYVETCAGPARTVLIINGPERVKNVADPDPYATMQSDATPAGTAAPGAKKATVRIGPPPKPDANKTIKISLPGKGGGAAAPGAPAAPVTTAAPVPATAPPAPAPIAAPVPAPAPVAMTASGSAPDPYATIQVNTGPAPTAPAPVAVPAPVGVSAHV